MKCIDAHIHTWDLERASYQWLKGNTTILNRNYRIDELEPQLPESGVTEGVLVQAANTVEETLYLLDVAARTPWLTGVVGWLPLQQPDEVARILEDGYAKNSLFKGVRHLIHDEPDAGWLLQPPVMESLQLLAAAGIPYDVVGVLPAHLEAVLRLLNKIPAIKLVLDHMNQPPVKTAERFGRWGELMSEIAKHTNVYAKISGLGTTAGKGENWGVENIKPYVDYTLGKFSTERCFCGGDWPVSLLAGSYQHTWRAYRQTLSSLLNEKEMEQVLYTAAKQVYKL